MENIKEKHPSYGMLGFSKASLSDGKALFGSSIKHDNTIVMTLKHAETDRRNNNDYYYGKGMIAQVEMSNAQFAELITSMNMGDGIPVTIRYTETDGYIKGAHFESKQMQFEREFSNHLDEIKKYISERRSEISEIFDTKRTLSKGDREMVLGALDSVIREIGANTEYIYSMFNEQMEKTVSEAKGEIEAFVQNKLNSIATEKLTTDDILKLE
ncbi:MAG: hypothetical protein IJH36_04485 [Clostridia bacterium]|nr:hypothetical protein [Clostridia bacterium]